MSFFDPEAKLILPITMTLFAKDAGIEGTLKTYINNSQITAHFTSKQTVVNIFTLKNYVEDAIRTIVDIIGYTNSCGFDLEITSLIDASGNIHQVFGVNFAKNSEEFSKKRPCGLNEILQLYSHEERYLPLCLGDLREAIRNPKDAGFFCYRGIECLTQFFAKKFGLEKGKLWDRFRDELGIVGREDIDEIKKFADPVRHGDTIYISPEDRIKILNLSWEIVDKYILFARNGYKKCQM